MQPNDPPHKQQGNPQLKHTMLMLFIFFTCAMLIGLFIVPMARAVDPESGLANQMAVNPDWNNENTYWEDNFATRPYASGRTYDDFAPAYEYGFNSYTHYRGAKFDDLKDDELSKGWEQARGKSNLTWAEVREAVRDSYNRRLERH